MPTYAVTGDSDPSCNVSNTGEAYTTFNGEPAYRWQRGVVPGNYWYLFWCGYGAKSLVYRWAITSGLPGNNANSGWYAGIGVTSPLQNYTPILAGSTTGTATVAEYVPPADDTPDDFSFPAVVDADPETQYVSDPAEVTNMDAGTAISVANGEYRINGGAWTSDAGTIDPEDTLELRATSSGEPKGVVAVSVTVGTLTKEWTVETRQARRFRFVCEEFVF